MSDTNKNGQIDPDEAAQVVGEEETVNEALVDNAVTEEEVGEIESLDGLEKEAQKIEMEKSMGSSADFTQIKPEESPSQVVEEEKEEEEQPAATQSTPTPPEVTAEISKEPISEATQEGVREIDDLTSEFKQKI